nr:MAG TPA: hypothetical protein [Crassvirales sp.]
MYRLAIVYCKVSKYNKFLNYSQIKRAKFN